ncbi:MAG: threonylcarbamoyl-AMP synthase [Bdellovibrionales bacterium]|nr:threonylcarbamoyl-AMP synthase [Bdellovibrionales bacterium]
MSKVDLSQALHLLLQGKLVAVPTETVYGLAAIYDSTQALKEVFQRKERPLFDPLILHVSSLDQALLLADWDPLSLALAKHFWPGPLTLVLPKTDLVDPLITAGGPTVALRCPDHPLTQELIRNLNKPLAAPSANRFGHTSPTTADHVLQEFADQVPVLDGGPCTGGIESTVIEVNKTYREVRILRPGALNEKVLKAFLDERGDSHSVVVQTADHSPGHLKNHYQPTVLFQLVIYQGDSEPNEEVLKTHSIEGKKWTLPRDPLMAARQLYGDLRKFSKSGRSFYLCFPEASLQDPIWRAVGDRIRKASHQWFLSRADGKITMVEKT